MLTISVEIALEKLIFMPDLLSDSGVNVSMPQFLWIPRTKVQKENP
jgi:hypothetical protein